MQNLSLNEWIGILAVIVALIIGVIQIVKKDDSTTVKLKQGAFSKGKQNVNIKQVKK